MLLALQGRGMRHVGGARWADLLRFSKLENLADLGWLCSPYATRVRGMLIALFKVCECTTGTGTNGSHGSLQRALTITLRGRHSKFSKFKISFQLGRF